MYFTTGAPDAYKQMRPSGRREAREDCGGNKNPPEREADGKATGRRNTATCMECLPLEKKEMDFLPTFPGMCGLASL